MMNGCLVHFVKTSEFTRMIHTPHLIIGNIIDVLHNLPFVSVIKTLYEIYTACLDTHPILKDIEAWEGPTVNDKNNRSHMKIHGDVFVVGR